MKAGSALSVIVFAVIWKSSAIAEATQLFSVIHDVVFCRCYESVDHHI